MCDLALAPKQSGELALRVHVLELAVCGSLSVRERAGRGLAARRPFHTPPPAQIAKPEAVRLGVAPRRQRCWRSGASSATAPP